MEDFIGVFQFKGIHKLFKTVGHFLVRIFGAVSLTYYGIPIAPYHEILETVEKYVRKDAGRVFLPFVFGAEVIPRR